MEDIEGLLALGVPQDEYSSEARRIGSALASRAPEELDEDSAASTVQEIWIDSFGPFSDEDLRRRGSAFRRVAGAIVRALKATNAR